MQYNTVISSCEVKDADSLVITRCSAANMTPIKIVTRKCIYAQM